jgi:hypothetical protein
MVTEKNLIRGSDVDDDVSALGAAITSNLRLNLSSSKTSRRIGTPVQRLLCPGPFSGTFHDKHIKASTTIHFATLLKVNWGLFDRDSDEANAPIKVSEVREWQAIAIAFRYQVFKRCQHSLSDTLSSVAFADQHRTKNDMSTLQTKPDHANQPLFVLREYEPFRSRNAG